MTGNICLQTSKKGLESISSSSDLTCFIPSKAGANTVPSILKIEMTARVDDIRLD